MVPYATEVRIVQVDRPLNGWCDSGHRWKEGALWQKLPDQGPELLVFFRITAQDHTGTYCEPCMILAQNMAAARKLAIAKGKI